MLAGESEPMVIGEKFVISSKIMDEDRTLLVVLPDDYENSKMSYPVLYLTDGPSHVNHTAATVAFLAENEMMPEMIVVRAGAQTGAVDQQLR